MTKTVLKQIAVLWTEAKNLHHACMHTVYGATASTLGMEKSTQLLSLIKIGQLSGKGVVLNRSLI